VQPPFEQFVKIFVSKLVHDEKSQVTERAKPKPQQVLLFSSQDTVEPKPQQALLVQSTNIAESKPQQTLLVKNRSVAEPKMQQAQLSANLQLATSHVVAPGVAHTGEYQHGEALESATGHSETTTAVICRFAEPEQPAEFYMKCLSASEATRHIFQVHQPKSTQVSICACSLHALISVSTRQHGISDKDVGDSSHSSLAREGRSEPLVADELPERPQCAAGSGSTRVFVGATAGLQSASDLNSPPPSSSGTELAHSSQQSSKSSKHHWSFKQQPRNVTFQVPLTDKPPFKQSMRGAMPIVGGGGDMVPPEKYFIRRKRSTSEAMKAVFEGSLEGPLGSGSHKLEAIVDSGASGHFLGKYVKRLLRQRSTDRKVRVADGSAVPVDAVGDFEVPVSDVHGHVLDPLLLKDASLLKSSPFNLVSVGVLCDTGSVFHFEKNNSWFTYQGRLCPLIERDGLYYLRLDEILQAETINDLASAERTSTCGKDSCNVGGE
jgi:hypothetical protein